MTVAARTAAPARPADSDRIAKARPRGRLRRPRHARPVLPDPGAADRAEHGQRARARRRAGLVFVACVAVFIARSSSAASRRLAALLIARQPDAARRLARAVDVARQLRRTASSSACADRRGLRRSAGRSAPAQVPLAARAAALRASGLPRAPSRSASSRPIRSSCWHGRPERLAQVDRQFRHPDPDLRHARLGPEHRRRPRRPARPRLRRLLRGRRLFLRAAGDRHFGLSFWICLPLAGILAAFWGILLGFPVLRLRGDYLAIVTLAFGEIIRLVLINWVDFTNGYAGISSIPRPTFFGIPFNAARQRLRRDLRARVQRRSTARSSSIYLILAWRC